MAQSDKGMPQVGIFFKSSEEAWLFWRAYGGRVGFDVRKRYNNVSKGSILDRQGRNVVENPKLEALLRYKGLSHKFHDMAYKVAYSTECCLILENALDCVGPQLEEKLNASTGDMNEPSKAQENVDPNLQQGDDLLRAAQLKKKEVKSKNSKRKKNWLDKLHKAKRKATKAPASTKKGAKQKKKNDGVQPEVEVVNDGSKRSENAENEKYIAIESFTQLLTAPTTCGDDSIYGENFF